MKAPIKARNTLWMLLVLLSRLSGYLFSKVSWIGGVGIKWIYKEYGFLKVWWQAAMVVLLIYAMLYTIAYFGRKLSRIYSRYIPALLLISACVGIYFTYMDFSQTLSHRWLGERFHLGAYCFWLGWIAIGVYFAISKSIASDNKETTSV